MIYDEELAAAVKLVGKLAGSGKAVVKKTTAPYEVPYELETKALSLYSEKGVKPVMGKEYRPVEKVPPSEVLLSLTSGSGLEDKSQQKPRSVGFDPPMLVIFPWAVTLVLSTLVTGRVTTAATDEVRVVTAPSTTMSLLLPSPGPPLPVVPSAYEYSL